MTSMNVLNRQLSMTFTKVHKAAEEAAWSRGKQLVYKFTFEHTNPEFHDLRGLSASVQRADNQLGIYLNKGLTDQEFEKVAVHELCHEIARQLGFGYEYFVTAPVERIADRVEHYATFITNCFTHVSVHRLMKGHGYSVADFDNSVLEEIRQWIIERRRIGRESVAMNATQYISQVFLDRYAVAGLDVVELADLYEKWDTRILEFTDRLLNRLGNVNPLNVQQCFSATRCLRDAIGAELAVNFASMVRLKNPQTNSWE